MVLVGDFVYPGDIIDSTEIGALGQLYKQNPDEKKFKPMIGPGLRYDDAKGILITRFGLLKMRGPPPIIKKGDGGEKIEEQQNSEDTQSNYKSHKVYLWVESPISNYQLPCAGDNVIGTIIKPKGTIDSILVDIGCARPAVLPELAFEGATKRNRPEARMGDLVYARLTTADKDIEPELTCKRSEAKGGGPGLGLLTSRVAELFSSAQNKDQAYVPTDASITGEKTSRSNKTRTSGFAWETSVDHVVKVLLATNTNINLPDGEGTNSETSVNLFKLLGSVVPFEIVVGMNGRIWVRSKTPELTLKVYNVIESLKSRSLEECIKLWAPILGAGWSQVPIKGGNHNREHEDLQRADGKIKKAKKKKIKKDSI